MPSPEPVPAVPSCDPYESQRRVLLAAASVFFGERAKPLLSEIAEQAREYLRRYPAESRTAANTRAWLAVYEATVRNASIVVSEGVAIAHPAPFGGEQERAS